MTVASPCSHNKYGHFLKMSGFYSIFGLKLYIPVFYSMSAKIDQQIMFFG